jgi:hypothetical protein
LANDTTTPIKRKFRAASDPTSDPKVDALFKHILRKPGALNEPFYNFGDPKIVPLIDLKGSFVTPIEHGCPENYNHRSAFYDLAPELLRCGYEGKFLVFGYGPKWYATGDSLDEARSNFKKQYKNHLPSVSDYKITHAAIETKEAEEYYLWKKNATHDRDLIGPPEPSFELVLLTRTKRYADARRHDYN